MTLSQRAQAISATVRDLKALEIRAKQAELFEKRANDLELPAVNLRRLEAPIAVFLEQKIVATAVDVSVVTAVKSRIKDLESRYLLDKNVMLDPFPNEDIRYVLNSSLQQLPDRLGAALLESWREWSRRQLPSVDDEVLTLLEKIQALCAPAREVKRLKQEAERLCSSLPTDKEAVTQLTALASAMTETWIRLTGEGVPLPVLAFLRKAITPEGARLQDLSQEVRSWMSEHGLSDSLRVRVG